MLSKNILERWFVCIPVDIVGEIRIILFIVGDPRATTSIVPSVTGDLDPFNIRPFAPPRTTSHRKSATRHESWIRTGEPLGPLLLEKVLHDTRVE